MKNFDPLINISPIDGRYRSKTETLADYFSEFALIKYRIKIEVLYLIELAKVKVVRSIKPAEKKFLNFLWQKFTLEDAKKVKKIEKITNHDVKAVEYFIKKKIAKSSLKDLIPFVHFGLTSEDVTNLAYGLMIQEALEKVYHPQLTTLIDKIRYLAKKNKTIVMLSRTHGQASSPTTLGKELAVFVYRLEKQLKVFPQKMSGKLAGAVGNFNAHQVAYPKINWIDFAKKFITSLGLEPWLVVTQIEPHDRTAEIFQAMIRIDNILLDFVKDIWLYISFDYLTQKVVEDEVGSSTMPHKVNPIDFENAEGNLGFANAIFNHFVEKLSISRLQRDLSDSTVMRNIGVAFAHNILAFTSITKGLDKIQPNKAKIVEEVKTHPELVSEAIQTILRREKIGESYELLKKLTRGKKVTYKRLKKFIDKLKVSAKVKKELKAIKPENYLGLAEKLTEIAIRPSSPDGD